MDGQMSTCWDGEHWVGKVDGALTVRTLLLSGLVALGVELSVVPSGGIVSVTRAWVVDVRMPDGQSGNWVYKGEKCFEDGMKQYLIRSALTMEEASHAPIAA